MNDDATVAAVVEELRRHEDHPMELWLRPVTVFHLTGLIQLAMRHPTLSDENRAQGARFVATARAYFAACPNVLDVIRRGDDPQEDR